jgi:membrane-bound lytic murein transglycosylase D
LALLPQVTLSFSANVYPQVGAAGMWQFIPSAGQQFMRIDYVLDRCLVPCAALHAAVEFLTLNYAVPGTEPLAITAYSHVTVGMRCVAFT